MPASLARRGVRFVVVETDAVGSDAAIELIEGAREIKVADAGVRLFQLRGVKPVEIVKDDRMFMTAAFGVAGLTLSLALISLVREGARRLHRKPAKDRPRQVPKP